MKRIVLIVAVVMVAVVSGFLWYSQRAKQRALESGDVYVRNEGAAPPATPAPSSAPSASTTVPEEVATNAKPSAASAPSTVHASETPAPHVQPQGAIAVPPGDTIQRNPPVGLAYAGSGKYQLYRQGDVTWRFNTDTGQACILFATDPLWSKARVYAHGCGVS
jgi:hypothetical protein